MTSPRGCSGSKFLKMDTNNPRLVALTFALTLAASAPAQVKTEVPPVEPGSKPVTVENIKIHGAALEGNLEGNAVDRDVIVVLPPSYAKQKRRRYPVVYGLHGYSIGSAQWAKEIHVRVAPAIRSARRADARP